MTSPRLDLRRLDGFSGLRFIRVPVSDGVHLYGVQTEGTVLALQRDGRVAWTRRTTRPLPPLTAQVRSAVRGRALLVSDEYWTALELASGALRWRADIEADLAGAAFDGDYVWTYLSGQPPTIQARPIIEVALAAGSIRTIATRPSWGTVLSASDGAVIALERNRLTSIELTSGVERWSLTLERPSCEYGRKRAVVLGYAHRHESHIIVPLMGYGFVAIDIDTGAIVWDADLQIVGMESVLAGDRLHVQSTWRFVELNATTGAVLSDVEVTDPAERRKMSSPGPLVHHADVLYAANRDGTVFGWDTVAQRPAWFHTLGARVEWSCPPQVFLDALWILDAQGTLHAFELPDGR